MGIGRKKRIVGIVEANDSTEPRAAWRLEHWVAEWESDKQRNPANRPVPRRADCHYYRADPDPRNVYFY